MKCLNTGSHIKAIRYKIQIFLIQGIMIRDNKHPFKSDLKAAEKDLAKSENL